MATFRFGSLRGPNGTKATPKRRQTVRRTIPNQPRNDTQTNNVLTLLGLVVFLGPCTALIALIYSAKHCVAIGFVLVTRFRLAGRERGCEAK